MDAVVLQRVDGSTHAAVIGTERYCASEAGWREAASTAKMRGGDSVDGGLVKGVAATLAHEATMDGNFSPAGATNWN
jgi:hypothetical protein